MQNLCRSLKIIENHLIYNPIPFNNSFFYIHIENLLLGYGLIFDIAYKNLFVNEFILGYEIQETNVSI